MAVDVFELSAAQTYDAWKAESALNTACVFGSSLGHVHQELAFYVLFDVGTTAGQVVIETAHDPQFTGTWDRLYAVNWLEANRVHHVAVTGVHLAIRARISSAVLGGTSRVLAAIGAA